MPYFCGSGRPVVTVDSSWVLLIPFFFRSPCWICLGLHTRQYLFQVAEAEKSTAGGRDGWAWNEIKALPLAWFSGLAILLNMVEATAVWPRAS